MVVGVVVTAGQLTVSLARGAGPVVRSLVDVVRAPRQAARGLARLTPRQADLDGVVAHVDLDAAARRLDVKAVVKGVDAVTGVMRAHVDTVLARVRLDGATGRLDVRAEVHGLHATRQGPPTNGSPSASATTGAIRRSASPR